jgi:uncharacterized protein YkuJ
VITVDSIDDWVDENETGSDNERLHIVTDDGVWSLEIHASENSGFEVRVNGDSKTYETESLDIDLVAGEITYDGSETADIDPIPTDTDTIEFENGDTTSGTFELHSNASPTESNLTEYDSSSSEGPYYTYPVESIDLRIHYETSKLRFVTEETVRTEEP